ncbi:MAG: HEPN domain-containing protein [bacterium]|nr:HEPN domain-containing protein [bacterium]
MKQEDSTNYKDWFRFAQDDLSFAKAGFRETGIARDACFLSHQAVEKYLKGFLVSKNVKPERTHLLTDILESCASYEEHFLDFYEQCDFLNQFYNPVRYPGGVILDFDKGTGTKALKVAEEVINFIQEKVK